MMAPADLDAQVLDVFDVDPAEMAPYLALGEGAHSHHDYSLASLVERAQRLIGRG